MLEKYNEVFKKQKMMRPVLIALVPLIILSVFFYGWRSLAIILVNIIVACLVEYICESQLYKKNKITEAAIVSAILYSMTLPPSIPFWISAIGMVAGILFGKELFGGFGRNVFNPALVGRLFAYTNFPSYFTMYWNAPANGGNIFSGLGGFTLWLSPAIDSTSTATPMMALREAGSLGSYADLFLGNIPGSIGETCKLFIIIGAIYLVYKKVASWDIMLSQIIGFNLTSLLLMFLGFDQVQDPLTGMLLGGFLFGAVFMSTDPISAPKTKTGKWFYGILIGFLVVMIRSFSLYSGGMMFAIILGNVFSPIVDYIAKQRKARAQKAVE